MTKRCRGTFLPADICAYGGILRAASADKSRLAPPYCKYLHWYGRTFGNQVATAIAVRLARSGKVRVADANKVIWLACARYATHPNTTVNSVHLDGLGVAVLGGYGNAVASVCGSRIRLDVEWALHEARDAKRAHSLVDWREVWFEGASGYAAQKPCRWCGTLLQFREHWVRRDDKTIRCNSYDCRRMDYLEHRPQSRGGINLTPAQREGLDKEAWPTQRAINYLILRAKELKHGCKPTHDVRRRASNHRSDGRRSA